MKPISKSDFQTLLTAACILTCAQDEEDDLSVDIAFDLWLYISACRKKYPDLNKVTLPK